MTPLPILGVLLELGEYLTHWPVFRWLGYAFSIAGLVLALRLQHRALSAPQVVMLRCQRCGYLGGDAAAIDGHVCLEKVA